MKKGLWKRRAFAFLVAAAMVIPQGVYAADPVENDALESVITEEGKMHENGCTLALWTIVNKKDTIFKYIFWERLDSLPIPECCFHFIWCQIA